MCCIIQCLVLCVQVGSVWMFLVMCGRFISRLMLWLCFSVLCQKVYRFMLCLGCQLVWCWLKQVVQVWLIWCVMVCCQESWVWCWGLLFSMLISSGSCGVGLVVVSIDRQWVMLKLCFWVLIECVRVYFRFVLVIWFWFQVCCSCFLGGKIWMLFSRVMCVVIWCSGMLICDQCGLMVMV